MKSKIFQIIILFLLSIIFISSCQGNSIFESTLLSAPEKEKETAELPLEEVEKSISASPMPEIPASREMVIWVPPQFDPSMDNASGRLLAARIEKYQRDHPYINLIVRVKAATGPGGLLESLTYASAVATDALPEVILFSRSDMLQAISRNLISPIEDLTTTIDDDDFYDFSRDLGLSSGTSYGLPFVSNILAIVHQPGLIENSQPGWDEIYRSFNNLIFPAADPDAIVTLALYLSARGEIIDSQGHQTIDMDDLKKVLMIYDESFRRGLLPFSLTEIQTDDQAWEFFRSNKSDAVITWASRQLNEDNGLQLTILPSVGNGDYTMATGWIWCLSAVDQEMKTEAVQLIEYLVAADFLQEWSPVSGFLPVRMSSLAGFSDSSVKNTISNMLTAARLRPNRDQVSVITPEIKNAVLDVLTRQSTPEESVQKLLERLEASET